MAWTTPVTAVDGVALTAAQWNASVRDNLNLTPAALATTAGSFTVATGTNAVAERLFQQAIVNTSETTSSTSYTALATPGPVVTAVTGSQAAVWINASIANSASNTSAASFAISGATTTAADNTWAIQQDGGTGSLNSFSRCALMTLTPGTNVFTMQYLVSSGASTGTFSRRREQVLAL